MILYRISYVTRITLNLIWGSTLDKYPKDCGLAQDEYPTQPVSKPTHLENTESRARGCQPSNLLVIKTYRIWSSAKQDEYPALLESTKTKYDTGIY